LILDEMTFHTLPFLLLFLPIVVVLYRLAAAALSRHAANLLLLGGSITFYAMSGLRNMPVILLSLLVNHFVGLCIAKHDEAKSRLWLTTGIAFNVALLCWFKYPGLFPAAIGATRFLANAGLPLGISFFTVQQIMYLMDIREKLAAPATLFDHAQAILYFPSVTAGPITRPQDIIRELHSEKKRDWMEDIGRGLVRFALGLFKKIVIADNLAVVVSAGYAATAELGAVEAFVVCCCVTLQVYFDFCGYCDMAIGVGRMLGHTVPENFDNQIGRAHV
jgi:D-alanyl-lipoteichoic acid acyltransferase DltB (MBOAT superfamily)